MASTNPNIWFPKKLLQVKTSDESTLLEEAIHYASLGMSIIPVCQGSKVANIKWTPYQSVRAEESQLCEWFSSDQHNLAVVLGDVSGGLTCCDFDLHDSYTKWAGQFPEWAEKLPTVETARGYHVYFRSAESTTRMLLDFQTDIKASGYTLLPPSVHESGVIYTWINPMLSVDTLPLLDPFEWFSSEFTQDSQEGQEIQENHDIQDNQAMGIGMGIEEKISLAIAQTIPTDEGQRNQCVFQLCRKLKAIPELGEAETDMLRSIVRKWHSMALSKIRTKDFTSTWSEFNYGWDKVRYPEGETLLKAKLLAIEQSQEPQVQNEYDCEKTRFLIRLCFQLQQLRCDKSMFFISCRDAGECSGFSHSEAAKRLRMLVTDGVLEIVKENTRKHATVYRFIKETSNG